MLPSFIQALKNPACYPHPVTTEISIIETQVSWVLLTGEFAYKIKKQLNFGFLDFSTLEKRLFYCEEELRLNQRLAPDIYQAVVAISGTAERPIIALNDHRFGDLTLGDEVIIDTESTTLAAVLEYAVRMQQFDPNAGLNDLLQQNKFDPSWIEALAEQLAKFHLTLPTVTTNSPWGEPDNIWQLVSDNFLHTLDFYSDSEDLAKLKLLYTQITQEHTALTQVFKERRKLGFVRECHGDLHLGNVTYFQNQVRLFDCIEFNLQFRWLDTCSDLAFLLMDLEANNKAAWANLTLNRYLEKTGDYQCLQLLNFYKSFRSMVRAKVATLGNQANDQTFKKYLYLTQSYQEQSPPAIYLMHGLSGTGKSYLSHKMIKAINAIRIRSEIERDRIYKELQRKGKKLELHSPEVNSRLSHHLIKLTEQLLSMGYKVIVDGTFLKQHFRQKYLRLAAKHNVPIKIISCQCNYNLMQARLKKAIRTESITRDRSLQRLALQASDQQLLSQDEIPFQHKVDTDDDQAINRFLIELKSQ